MGARILKKELIAPSVYRIEVEAPEVARKHLAGQFVILRVSDRGERIPLTVLEKDPASRRHHHRLPGSGQDDDDAGGP